MEFFSMQARGGYGRYRYMGLKLWGRPMRGRPYKRQSTVPYALPRLIAPPHPSRHLFFFLSPPCQVEVESDPAKLISDESSSEN